MNSDKIILGTVQFGLKYGINNSNEKPNNEETYAILDYALSHGIKALDTAAAYGNATEIIGNYHREKNKFFKIITKFKDVDNEQSFIKWFYNTLDKLEVSKIHGCMYHAIDDYLHKPYIKTQLEAFWNKGLVELVGVSVYTNEQFEKLIDDDAIHLIQLPFNLFDNTSLRGELIEKAKEKGKMIHVRSVFLQGLFFMDPQKLPTKLQPLSNQLNKIKRIALDNHLDINTLALAYANSNPLIDGILIGVDAITQLQANISSLNITIPEEVIIQINRIKVSNTDLLNPVNWS